MVWTSWFHRRTALHRLSPARSGRRAGIPFVLAAASTIAITFLLSACVGTAPEVGAGDPVLQLGRDVYVRNCVNCHGSAGQGGRGNRLNGGAVLSAFADAADQASLIAAGRDQMPSYSDKLTFDEIDAVVRYTREVLNADG